MQLSPREKDKLLTLTAALLANYRKAKDIKLNHTQTVAYMSAALMAGVRNSRSVAKLLAYGWSLLISDDLMAGIAAMLTKLQVAVTFPNGTQLVTVHDPIN